MNKSKLIDALNLDLEHEMSGLIRYLHHSFIVAGPNRGPLVEMFRARATDNMQHAIRLGEKIVALGGHPSVKIQEVYEPGEQSVEDMLSEDLEMEKSHLALYEEQLKTFQDNTVIRLMFEQFILEENQHLDDLTMYLRDSRVSTTAKSR